MWGKECSFAKDAIPGAPAGAIRNRLDQLEKLLPHKWAARKHEDWINMQWETVEMEMEDAVKDLGLEVPPPIVAPPQLKPEFKDREAEVRRLKTLKIRQMCGWMGLPSWVLLVKGTQTISVVQSVSSG